MKLRSLRAFALAVACGFACAAGAQSYPSKPIRIIIPFPPGNTVDIMARLIGPKMTERLGQNVIVDNRAGAAGQLGLELGARAAPDGYTLVGGQGGNLVVQPHTYKKLPYDPLKDFAPIALSTTNYLGLVVHPGVPFKSVQELITYAKTNPNKITFASNGEGGFPHMTIELLRVMAGFTYVKEKLVAAGLIVVTEPPEYFAATLKSDFAKYGKLIRDIGFQPQ